MDEGETAISVDTKTVLSLGEKRIVSPSYLPKTHTKEDLREAKTVQGSYPGIGGFEGLVVDLYKANMIMTGHDFEHKELRSFDGENLPENSVLIVDPRLDLLFLPMLSQTLARRLIEVFDKMLLFSVSGSLTSARKLLEEERQKLRVASHRKRLLKGGAGSTGVYMKSKSTVEKLEHALLNEAQKFVSSDRSIEALVKSQLSWNSDIIVPPYFPLDLSLSNLEPYMSVTTKSYKIAKALAANAKKAVAFPICLDIVSPNRSKEEALKGIDKSASIVADLLSEAGNPSLLMLRVADMRETSPQLILYLKTIRNLKKLGVNFVHALDPGSTTILGIYFFNHGLNSFSCLPSRPPATGGRGGTLKVEGRYLWLDTLEIMNDKRLAKRISSQGEVPCDCSVCKSNIRIVQDSNGQPKVEGINEIFYERRKGAPEGWRITTRNRRAHHFLYNLLKLQSLSRTKPSDFATRIKDCAENCEKHTAVFEISKKSWQ